MTPKIYLLKRSAVSLTVIVAVVALLVIAGWLYGNKMLKRSVPGSMRPFKAFEKYRQEKITFASFEFLSRLH